MRILKNKTPNPNKNTQNLSILVRYMQIFVLKSFAKTMPK